MDTANDFRIRLAEKAFKELENSLNNVRLQRRKEMVREISNLRSDLQIIKYSYMPFGDLAEYDSVAKISRTASEFLERVMEAERDFHQLNAKYWLDYLASLPVLFQRGDISRAYEAIKYFSGEIISSVQISQNLWLCSFDCGFKLEVVTNSKDILSMERSTVSFLPPRQFGNIVSEGMFVSAQLDRVGELTHKEILSIKDSLGEVEAVLLNLF